MDAKEIQDQKLSLLLADFQICRKCGVVDRDHGRMQEGHRCSTCGTPGEGGLMYFDMSVLTLIDLMQEAFHTPGNADSSQAGSNREGYNISVVLFFCTLREVLINRIIERLCHAQSVPRPIYERLLADSNTYSLRQNSLLPSLTGKRWKDLVTTESKCSKLDYIELDGFLKTAVKARNKFMHEGKPWGIDKTLAGNCVDHIWPLLCFYVALHNRYVHSLHFSNVKP